ncbi:hypothetical protein WICPIJ_009704 [Wickerhamomyces pijperi]|uniref:Uncharacterized protein n=1 Tax=Wickerhamomyces pijperi TaxID=599730 RepID=A0A9P8PLQ5_WICPI|nr:hypothetical protein WICPIJ_009704 [Wickerhamomyces pijperi]
MLSYHNASPFYPFSQVFDGPRPLSYLCQSRQPQLRRAARSGSSYNDELSNIVDSLMRFNHPQPQPQPPRVQTSLHNLTNSYQIKLSKRVGDFDDYVIRFTTIDHKHEVKLSIKSETDSFEKDIMFKSKDIKVNHIDYHIEGSTMIVIVPKRHASTATSTTASSSATTTSSSNSSNNCAASKKHVSKPKSHRSHSSRSSPRRLSNQFSFAADATNVVPIPVNFHKSQEAATPTDTVSSTSVTNEVEAEAVSDSQTEEYQSDSDSIASLTSEISHLPKVVRKASLEDVADEGF